MPTDSFVPAFQISVRVEKEDIDQQGHASNITYLRWVQDVAVAHWERIAPEADKTGPFWVVLRHEIDYKVAALLGDELIVETQVGEVSGLTFERHVVIRRAADGKLLARARTLWCPINAESGRPQRVSREVRALFSSPAGG